MRLLSWPRSDPREALDHTAVGRLEEVRSEVDIHRRAAMRTPPEVDPGAALIRPRVHSPAASAWPRRLAPRTAVVANSGWMAGLVSFVVRSAAPVDRRALLRAVYRPPPGSGDYAMGHTGATRGSLTPDAFEAFARPLMTAPEAAG